MTHAGRLAAIERELNGRLGVAILDTGGGTARVSCRRSVPDVQYIAAREHKRSGPIKIGMHDLGSSNDLAAKLLLQVTTQVLAEEWEHTFRYWHPDLRSKTDPKATGWDLPRNLTLSDTTRDSRMRMNHSFMAWRRSDPDTSASLREDFSLCSRAAAACG